MVDWQKIETVLLDMDGTLLDRNFDDYFWERFVPALYAEKNTISEKKARKHLQSLYRSREGTLDWTDLDYWSKQLGLDIPALKVRIDHLIAVHPYVRPFLSWARARGKMVVLVTNAHSKTLEIKMGKTALAGYFHHIVCSQDIGVAKEDPLFWQRLGDRLPYDPRCTLLADDTEAVLDSAARHGIAYLIHVARPSSTIPVKHSTKYQSIVYFKELLPDGVL